MARASAAPSRGSARTNNSGARAPGGAVPRRRLRRADRRDPSRSCPRLRRGTFSSPSRSILIIAMPNDPELDVLVLATHPDDAESTCGGTIAQLVSRGARVGVLDASRGEMGTRGTPESRAQECAAATQDSWSSLPRESWSSRRAHRADGRGARGDRPLAAPAAPRDPHRPLVGERSPPRSRRRRSDGAPGLLPRGAPSSREGPPRTGRAAFSTIRATISSSRASSWRSIRSISRRSSSRCARTAPKSLPNSTGDRGQHFVHGQEMLERIEVRARFFGSRIGVRFGEPLRAEGTLPTWIPSITRQPS